MSYQPLDLDRALHGLAELELLRARQLAWQLPEVSSFELRAEMGLRIGASGRRMSLLLDHLDDSVMTDQAPSMPDSWPYALPLRGRTGPCALDILYASAYQESAALGLRAYDMGRTLKLCQALAIDCALEAVCPVAGHPVLPALVELGRSAAGRAQSQPHRARRANPLKRYDARWLIEQPQATLPRMHRIEEREGLLHKLHHTAFRETVAAEVAALNMLEYDGMPWAFYIDMARQVEDESRHALLTRQALEAHGGHMGQFALSYLGNLYLMFFEMTLSERLVAMNLDTEAMSQPYLATIAERLSQANESDTSTLYRYIHRDESTHARTGARWFRYLYPSADARRHALEAAHAMTAINLASAHAAVVGGRIGDILDAWVREGIPLRFDHENSDRFEQEVSLATARSPHDDRR